MRAPLHRIAGVYLLTPDWQPGRESFILEATDAALRAGVGCVQYRNKLPCTPAQRREQVAALRRLVRRCDALLIVNDDAALAMELDADGVHLGADDTTATAARERLPAPALIGVSCYDRTERALQAQAAGADYVAFGAVFPSSVKPGAVRAPLALLTQARRLGLHPVAIGGIDSGNIGQVAAAGARAAAVITAVYGAARPEVAARTLSEHFAEGQALFDGRRGDLPELSSGLAASGGDGAA